MLQRVPNVATLTVESGTQSTSSSNGDDVGDSRPIALSRHGHKEAFKRKGKLHLRRYKAAPKKHKPLLPKKIDHNERPIKPEVELQTDTDEREDLFEYSLVEEFETFKL